MVQIHERYNMKRMWNLGRVRQIIEESLGLDITHFYDDMVFVEHSALLIVFDHNDTAKFNCYFNTDCRPEDRERMFALISDASPRNSMTAVNRGEFSMTQLEDEQIHIDLKPDI